MASLKKTHDFQLDVKQRSDDTNEFVDAIAAKRISKPGSLQGGHQTLPAGSAWMASGEIAQKYRGQAIETLLAEARSRSLKRQWPGH